MTKDPKPICFVKKPTPIRNALLVFFATLSGCQTAFIAYSLGQRGGMESAPSFQQASVDLCASGDWLACRQQAEKPHKKGGR